MTDPGQPRHGMVQSTSVTPSGGGAATLRVSIADDAPAGVDATINVPLTVVPKFTVALILIGISLGVVVVVAWLSR